MKSSSGKTYLEAEALWTLIDEKTRKPVNPVERGIFIKGFPFTKESEILPVVTPLPISQTSSRTVLYSELDLNGHLTNTRYGDWFMDAFMADLKEKEISSFNIMFRQEATEGETLELGIGKQADKVYLSGKRQGEEVFAISAVFR